MFIGITKFFSPKKTIIFVKNKASAKLSVFKNDVFCFFSTDTIGDRTSLPHGTNSFGVFLYYVIRGGVWKKQIFILLKYDTRLLGNSDQNEGGGVWEKKIILLKYYKGGGSENPRFRITWYGNAPFLCHITIADAKWSCYFQKKTRWQVSFLKIVFTQNCMHFFLNTTGGGSHHSKSYMWATLKVSVFWNGQFRQLFFLRKIFFFHFVLKKKTISPLKRELAFFENIFFYFFQKFLFFLSLFFVVSDTFFLFFFFGKDFTWFLTNPKKNKKSDKKNKNFWEK